MEITILKEMNFIDKKIKPGTKAKILTKNDLYKLSDRYAYLRAMKNYENQGRKGVFAFLAGKYRWINEDDYRKETNVRSDK